MGTCQYLLTGTIGSSSFPSFSVHVAHRQAWNTDVSMTEQVWLNFKSQSGNITFGVYMEIADPPQAKVFKMTCSLKTLEN